MEKAGKRSLRLQEVFIEKRLEIFSEETTFPFESHLVTPALFENWYERLVEENLEEM